MDCRRVLLAYSHPPHLPPVHPRALNTHTRTHTHTHSHTHIHTRTHAGPGLLARPAHAGPGPGELVQAAGGAHGPGSTAGGLGLGLG